ncbi:MAG TPA: VWA domain-containing protein [Candidatus Angelobacter sp.]|jgi:VWFA-related protein|nr:VWA domain-containing protein [Candidatus Angelobacter sp.]
MALFRQWPMNVAFLVLFCIGLQSQSSAPSPAAPASQQQAQSQDSQNTPPKNQEKSAAEEKPQKVYESATVLKTVTRLVVIDVVVTDNKGAPVTDLAEDNFTLLEDGKPQKIRVFNFQHPMHDQAPVAAQQASLKLPPNVFSNIPRYDIHNTLNVVLLDALNTTRVNQIYVRDQMIKYLEKMPSDQPVAVYALTTKLRILQDFTTDPSILKGVIKSLNSKSSPLLNDPTGNGEAPLFSSGVFESLPQQMQQSLISFEQESTNAQTDIRVSYTLAALKAIARNLAGYPGRKNLIWLSEAFPLSIDPAMDLDGAGFSNTSTRDYGPDIAQTADALMNSQVAVYPVDAQGLVGSSFFSASNNGTDKFGRSITRGGRMAQTMSNESAARFANHGTMQDLAERTGGKAFYNRNDIDAAIGHSIDDGSTYYTLAYYPDNKNWDGKFRKISVKVNRSGAKIRHRLGYFASDPRVNLDPKTRDKIFSEALDLDFPVSTGLLFEAGVVQPSSKTENKLLINFAVDPHALTFERKDDGLQHASVGCAVHIYSEKGKHVRTEVSGINAALKPDTFRKVMTDRFPCQDKLDLAPGNYILRLGVIDNATGLLGTANAKVTVLAPAPETAATKPQGSQQ